MSSSPREYKYYPEDFAPLTTPPLHFGLHFDVLEHRVRVTACTTFVHKGDAPLTELVLDAKRLSINSVRRMHAAVGLGADREAMDFVAHTASLEAGADLVWAYDEENNKLAITLDAAVAPGSEFTVETDTVCIPTEHILEGIYYDHTPEGAPRTLTSQSQQWGCQRIFPLPDRMRAKAYWTTTIVADTRYTRLLSNGAVDPAYVEENGDVKRVPYDDAGSEDAEVVSAGLARCVITYFNHAVPMAPYLFFFSVGAFVTHSRWLVYPTGAHFKIELLTFPGLISREAAEQSLAALHDSILWTYLSTGAEATEHADERAQVYRLLEEREALRASAHPLVWGDDDVTPPVVPALEGAASARFEACCAELVDLMGAWSETGYAYTSDVYREISQVETNFGGMENTHNTIIVASRIAPTPHTSDGAYIYMEGVKIHEYYHNINGSQVSGASPFEIWLNEAATVHIERKRMDDIFGAGFMRLQKVQYAFRPASGPLAQDLSSISMPIVPVGFNDTMELISATTYSKAPELIRMIELLMTPAVFNRGLANYYAKYAYDNATSADWIACMEEASGLELQAMADLWLTRPRYPQVAVTAADYDAGAQTYTVVMTQTGFEELESGPWDFPVSWALVKDGADTKTGVWRFSEAEATFVVDGVAEAPDYVSVSRDWSFFGTITNETLDHETRILQARTDPDVVCRYLAYRQFADAEKARLIEAILGGATDDLVVSPAFVATHAAILLDAAILPATRAQILSEDESIPSRPDLGHHYQAIADATGAMLQAVWDAHAASITDLYNEITPASCQPGPHLPGIQGRYLSQHLLKTAFFGAHLPSVLPARGDAVPEADVGAWIEAKLASPFQSDKLSALMFALKSSLPNRAEIIATAREEYRQHPDSWENFIVAIGNNDSDDAPALIRELMADPDFKPSSPGHSRTLARGWAAVRKRSLMTEAGRDLLVDIFVEIGRLNQASVSAVLQAFNDLDKFDEATQATLRATLERMRDGVDEKEQPSLFNRLAQILNN